MRAVTTRAPSEAQNRLTRARLALKLAEERTGLRDSAALEVQRAVSSAPIGTPAASPQATSLKALAASQDSGVLSLQGSTTLLLAALALRQGTTGWCAVVGGEGLGWCAATEVGLDLNRVLTVPASSLDDASALTVVSTLLDGVDSLLIGASVVARLRPQHRRRLLARARERGHLILTPAPWEGARTLRADSLPSDTGTADTSLSRPPVGPSAESAADGVVIPIGRQGPRAPVQAVEMPAGYLRRLTWTLTDSQRPRLSTTDVLTLSLSAEGLQAGSHDAVQPAPGSQEATG
ncbi:hypothetical protein E4J66_13585 [Actinomyces viscosus]|uniref:Uncharacterized protein n=1 Tax=Actinomyces viscosus TaxID=1656 RepID=A0A3S5EWA5_ACTVI|nr:hypothetical protein [Actinomyces viscosus]TFH50974.1 hypothetical protein E4J66_13585 [Actinomyces viscosus]VEI14736.1 Uncharacterised protein [Actinomyces viscosus]